MQAKLGTEVGNLYVFRVAVVGIEPGLLCPHVAIKRPHHRIVVLQVEGIVRSSLQLALACVTKKVHRVVVVQLPEIRIDLSEEILSLRMPCPPEVVRQLAKTSNTLGDGGK